MLNNTEYNGVVICVCPKGYSVEECYILLERGMVSFPNIKKLVKSDYAYLVEEIDAICDAYNQLCVEVRGDYELLDIAHDELMNDLDLCRARWERAGYVTEHMLDLAFNTL